jgi:acetyl-CoA carboxylase carboxyl transferase subunit alpha
MPPTALDFEKPVVELEEQLKRLEESTEEEPDREERLAELRRKLEESRRELYDNLTPWQRVQLARHPARPHSLDYIQRLFTGWTELHGDRHFGDDRAVVTGLAKFGDRPVAVIGQQKGSDTKDNILRNFGMMHPEGYRKALRVMHLAEKFELPLLCLIDTIGAFPGVGAEERGQGEAIARNIMEMTMLKTPIVCAIIGEGASGGALGVGVGDRLLMMEYSWYCVISPEGCASILWRDVSRAADAAQALKLTPTDLDRLGIVDEIIREPIGGAHRDPAGAMENLRESLARHLDELMEVPVPDLLDRRFLKYRHIGVYA